MIIIKNVCLKKSIIIHLLVSREGTDMGNMKTTIRNWIFCDPQSWTKLVVTNAISEHIIFSVSLYRNTNKIVFKWFPSPLPSLNELGRTEDSSGGFLVAKQHC